MMSQLDLKPASQKETVRIRHRRPADGWAGDLQLVAVGTAIARRPPHRSQRAELPHWAPTLGHDAEPHVGEWMPHACGWQPIVDQSFHSLPCQPADLAPPP